ncbi:MAG TPA: SRPBCC family protein [Rhizobiaceae bacterium]|nr:SRPBCC family protein [Rhizobiaceae bacterium]
MPNGRTDTCSRLIKAPAQKIYRAFTDPDAWVKWLPPEGMTGKMHHFDPRPGGTYRMTLTYAAAGAGKSSDDTDVVEGTFVELVPNERVVQEVVFDSDDPAFAGTMTMSWSLAPVAGGTEVEIIAENVPPGISKEDHDAGLRSTLENLAAFVE